MGEQEEALPCLLHGAEGGSPGGQGGCSRMPASQGPAAEAWLRLQGFPGGEGLCHKHQEPQKVFCKEDLSLLCLVCEKARQHRAHLVLPLEEAAQDYKEEIEIKLQKLKTERSAVQELKMVREKEMAQYLEDVKAKREKVVLEFQQLHLFLQEQERHLLAQLGELEKEMAKEQEETGRRLSHTFSLLSSLISDLEKDCQRPAGEFLLNLKETFTRCGSAMLPMPVERPSNLGKNLSAISQKSVALTENLNKFKETLEAELKRERTSCTNALLEEQRNLLQFLLPVIYEDAQQKASIEENVILDPRTANPKLLISQDRKRVRHWGYPQALPDNLERFDSELFVLGCEGFCSGKHSWRVAIEQGQSWAVGIARESVKRKGPLSLSPEQGIWAVEQCWGHFRALTSQWTSLPLARIPRRIQVCLDYERGRVAFFNADLNAPIFMFPLMSFKQERIYPWFWVGPGGQLSLCL
ncbi:tripartite motif-containing protein 15-like [Sceloporus undulatus]|uniref:tripartite motif-containing protein 15-like n=1 Tax=Sceloporus undulatus TaxID=8520 RepID=UPI001C4CFE15|nr:tripartite motif-containing protein 15-like [Sceloporus undulatus]